MGMSSIRADRCLRKGLDEATKGHYEVALMHFTRAIHFERPRYRGDAYFYRALTYQKAGDIQKAIADLGRVIRLEPDDEAAYVLRGILYQGRAQYKRAAADFCAAIRLYGCTYRSYLRRARAHCRQRKYEKVAAVYHKATWPFPIQFKGLLELGSERRTMWHEDRFIARMDEEIRRGTCRAAAYYLRGACNSRRGEYRQAVEDFTRAIQLKPTDILAYKGRANALRHLNYTASAASDERIISELSDRSTGVDRDPA